MAMAPKVEVNTVLAQPQRVSPHLLPTTAADWLFNQDGVLAQNVARTWHEWGINCLIHLGASGADIGRYGNNHVFLLRQW